MGIIFTEKPLFPQIKPMKGVIFIIDLFPKSIFIQ